MTARFGDTRRVVFLLGHNEAFNPVLQAKEVSDVLWVDVDFLLSAPIQTLQIPTKYIFPKVTDIPDTIDQVTLLHRCWFSRCWQQSKRTTLENMTHIDFPCIYLNRPDGHVHEYSDDAAAAAAVRPVHDFVLWGLTYNMTSDILKAGGHNPLPSMSAAVRSIRDAIFHAGLGKSKLENWRKRISVAGTAMEMDDDIVEMWTGEGKDKIVFDIIKTLPADECSSTSKHLSNTPTWTVHPDAAQLRVVYLEEHQKLVGEMNALGHEVDRQRRDMDIEELYMDQVRRQPVKYNEHEESVRALQQRLDNKRRTHKVGVIRLLGRGASSEVWQAYCLSTQTLLAVKLGSNIEYAANEYDNHKHNMAHGDLKPGNVLVRDTTAVTVQLTDFHLARSKSDAIVVGVNASPSYAPPEWYLMQSTEESCMARTSYDKADMWALGVIFYQCLFTRHPMGSFSSKDELKRNMHLYSSQSSTNQHHTLHFPTPIASMDMVRSASLCTSLMTLVQVILTRCLHPDWTQRPTAMELLSLLSHMS
ncbi:hypothetical protein DYB32_003816 [Aphanomyces invadans]|uniref:Protein kinase domain-containing protein n=1 Tax=Aphanomyces invadans TaxID=157072 RepID=A0A418AZB7_9STRA|nr:hypothetical protein DYB32_003816 [Aphanomyces invadans]